MTSFEFLVSDEDRTSLTELTRCSVRVLVDLDPLHGGIFMTFGDASLTWTWLEEIALIGDPDCVGGQEDGSDAYTDAGEAVAAALKATSPTSHLVGGTAMRAIRLAVTEEDFELLRSLEQGGFKIYLELNPHSGGIYAIHKSGISLKWFPITDLHLEPEPNERCELRTDDHGAMMKALQAAIAH